MAEEIYLLTLEAERDEEISKEELIRTIYQPSAEEEIQQDTMLTYDTRHQLETQEITKERILELVEEGTWSTEQGRREYGRLEEMDTPDTETTPAAPHTTRTHTVDTKNDQGHNNCEDGHDNEGNDAHDTVIKVIDTSRDTVAGVRIAATSVSPMRRDTRCETIKVSHGDGPNRRR